MQTIRGTNINPVVNASNRNVDQNKWVQLSAFTTTSDADGDAIVQFEIRDLGAGADSAYLWVNGSALAQSGSASSTNLATTWVNGGTVLGANSFEIRAMDIEGGWSAWTSFTVTTRLPNRLPVVTPTAATQSAVMGTAVAAGTLFGVSDLDGDTPVQYEFWDAGGGGGRFRVDGVDQAGGVTIPVTAAQLGTTQYVGAAASGSETVWVRAYDGQAWSAWASWTMQTVRATNANPVVSAADRNIDLNQWRVLSELVGTSDADGDAIVGYEVRDLTTTAGSGYLWANGASQPANTVVSFTDLASAWVRGGSAAGADIYEVRARDSEGAWSAWTPFTLTTRTIANRAPLADAPNNAVQVGQTAALSTLFSVSDADGDALFGYELWDGGIGGGRFRVNGVDQAGGVTIPVSTTQLAQTVYVAGAAPASETLWVRATDGQAWSAWEPWTMYTHNSPGNTAPVVTAANRNIDLNQWRLITELTSVTDANGNPILQYQVRDATGTANSGVLWADGVQYGQGATATTSSLTNTWVRGGAAAGPDTYEARAFDGIAWGAWTTFTLTTRAQANRAPVATPTAPTQNVGLNTAVAASALFGVADADGDAPFSFELWDGGAGGGLFQVSGVSQPANQSISLTAAQFAATTYVGGTSPGSETLWARVNDGQAWSGWVAWNMNSA
jgi:hypothetical protein